MAEDNDTAGRGAAVGEPRLTLVLWICAMTTLVLLSLWPASGEDKGAAVDAGQNVLWTLAHIPGYAVLVGLTVPLAFAVLHEPMAALVLSAAFGTGVGVVLELLQPLVGRTADVADVALNLLGVFLAISFWTGGRVMSRRGPGLQDRG